MAKNRDIRIRVTKDQLDRIRMNAQAKGFKNVSVYLRFLSLEHNNYIEDKIRETHRVVMGMNKKIESINKGI